MAFTFNWSAHNFDTTRARDLLTTALNKTPKPAIIVSDILVTELNLGSTPPDLDILEIGDLAEDRFRGIFKMTYTGDAFLTLKTKVQANPLNTYLSSKPSFANPRPLAASSGLTIPLQITLSDIRLSGFVILVFSRQKGITLVFRNDPLESLKVSSTFDTIPFVRDYLQKEIEAQLRLLFMEDLPAIIHRLSLRLWVPEHSNANSTDQIDSPTTEAQLNSSTVAPEQDTEAPINPLLTPSQKPQVDPFERRSTTRLDIPPLSLADSTASSTPTSGQSYPSFSHKNLVRLAALSSSHRTLSLFTPSIHDSVYRAWAAASENAPSPQIYPHSHSHPRSHARNGTGLTLASLSHDHPCSAPHSAALSESGASASISDGASLPISTPFSARPTLVGSTSATSFTHSSSYSFSGTHAGKPKRKRKHRVVNLRKPAATTSDDSKATANAQRMADGADLERPTTPASQYTGSYSYESRSSEGSHQPYQSLNERIREGEMQTPPDSPESIQKHRSPSQLRPSPPRQHLHLRSDTLTPHDSPVGLQQPTPQRPSTSQRHDTALPHAPLFPSSHTRSIEQHEDLDRTPRPPKPPRPLLPEPDLSPPTTSPQSHDLPAYPYMPPHVQHFASKLPPTDQKTNEQAASGASAEAEAGGGILNQAWLMKVAKDLAERQRALQVEQERARLWRAAKGLGSRQSLGNDGAVAEGEGVEDAPPPAYWA